MLPNILFELVLYIIDIRKPVSYLYDQMMDQRKFGPSLSLQSQVRDGIEFLQSSLLLFTQKEKCPQRYIEFIYCRGKYYQQSSLSSDV